MGFSWRHASFKPQKRTGRPRKHPAAAAAAAAPAVTAVTAVTAVVSQESTQTPLLLCCSLGQMSPRRTILDLDQPLLQKIMDCLDASQDRWVGALPRELVAGRF